MGDKFIVNGIEFEITKDTKVIVDGDVEVDASKLKDGQTITIKGFVKPTEVQPTDANDNGNENTTELPDSEINNDSSSTTTPEHKQGIATELIYNTQIQGEISKVTNESLTVLGQTIVYHKDILFVGFNNADSTNNQTGLPKLGDTIIASGFVLSNGELSATRIEKINSEANDEQAPSDQLIGPVSHHDSLHSTFLINGLTVHYDPMAVGFKIEDGITMRVVGTLKDQPLHTLDASHIEKVESSLGNDDKQKQYVELAGFITEFNSDSDFSVGEIPIFTDYQTTFIGNDREDLGLNTKIEVEGYLDNNNVLIAEKVIFLTAELISHTDRDTLSSSTQTFEWNDVNAEAYRLRVVKLGHEGFYDKTFDGDTTSTTISGLPENSTSFYLMLYTQQGEFWSKKVYIFEGHKKLEHAKLSSHNHKDILTGTSTTFTWDAVPEAEGYRLRIFDYITGHNYYEQSFNEPQAATVRNLPDNGADISVFLTTIHNGWGANEYYHLTSAQLVKNAEITSHVNGQKLSSSTQTFTWDDVGAEQYQLSISNNGVKVIDWMDFDSSTTSVTLRNLPKSNSEIIVKLRTKHSGWASKEYTFYGAGEIDEAELSSHQHNDPIKQGGTETFKWSEVPEAEKYQLELRNSNNIADSFRFREDYDSFITSATVDDLPRNNAVIRLILSTLHNGYWVNKEYKLHGSGELDDADITSHSNGQTINASSIDLAWNDVDADEYYLTVLDYHNRKTEFHSQSYSPDITSATVENLADNTELHITIYTRHGNWWTARGINVIVDNPPPSEAQSHEADHKPGMSRPSVTTDLTITGTLQKLNDELTINGITFTTTDSTNFIINGNSNRDVSALYSGQVVTIKGIVDEYNRGVATDILYHSHVSGKITQVSSASLTVLEQTILLPEGVIVEGTAAQLSDLVVGDTVNVSGYLLANGDLSATHINRTDTGTNQLIGAISELDTINETFVINGMTVDYSSATNLPELANDNMVNIKGEVDENTPARLNASTVNNGILELESNDSIKIEGFITRFNSAEDFRTGLMAVFTDYQTEFIGGERNDLDLNNKIKVEGYLDQNNVLIAEKILFLTAELISHTDRQAISSSTETFTWNDVDAKAYRVRIAKEEVSDFYDKTFDGDTTSITINGLPKTTTPFYFILYTQQGEFWSKKVYVFTGSKELEHAKLSSHKHGDTLTDTSTTFTWDAVPESESYRLRVFDYHSNTTYFEQTYTTPEAVTVYDLPTNGADVYVDLFTKQGIWESKESYELTSAQLSENAQIISHTNGQRLTSTTETFVWNDVGAQEYSFRIAKGRPSGGIEIIDLLTLDGSTTSVTLDNLPINDADIFIRLQTKHSGWAKKDYSFKGLGEIPAAELSSHRHNDSIEEEGSDNKKGIETFSWSEVPQAEKYQLEFRNPNNITDSFRFREDYNSFITSATFDNLPRNSAVIRLILSTLHNGYWVNKEYKLYGSGELDDAHITSHSNFQTINTSSINLTWNDVDADEYHLTVIDFKNSRNKFHTQPYSSDTTSATIENLPDNTELYIAIYTRHGDWWKPNGIRVTVDLSAEAD